MLIVGKFYKAKTNVTVQIQSKNVSKGLIAGNLDYLFSQSIIVPKNFVILVVENKKTTLNELTKVLFNNKIYNYFHNNKYCEEDWELIC